VDCSDISIDYSEEQGLTHKEKIARMDKALMDSLNKFELCQKSVALSASTNDGNGAAGDKNADTSASDVSRESGKENGGKITSDQGDGLEKRYESVASPELSGTEIDQESGEAAFDVGNSTQSTNRTSSKKNYNGAESSQRDVQNEITIAGNGQIPEDIPPANNDDTLAAQIRYAAENEPDPEKKKKLWNEYRKYKGLPIKQ
jgi:hypothetical protein